MAGECVSGVKFKEGDEIRGYKILKAFDPGGFAYAGKARSPSGKSVFFKNYKCPGLLRLGIQASLPTSRS